MSLFFGTYGEREEEMFHKEICLKCIEAWYMQTFGEIYTKQSMPEVKKYWAKGRVTCYYAAGTFYINEKVPDECIYLLEQTLADSQ